MMFQNWSKKGLILPPDLAQGMSHLAVPVVFKTSNFIRVFYSSRNADGKSLPYYLDYSINDQEVISHSKGSILSCGHLGSFDADGVMPTCIIKVDDHYKMYYIGWNRGRDVPFRNSIGLAISTDLFSWEKAFEGPIIDRAPKRPYFVASSEVVFNNGHFTMYFLNCTKWVKINDVITHHYHIQIAHSKDGVNWEDKNEIAIGFENKYEYAISRPSVIIENGKWHMWYSYRGSQEMEGYRIGYANSTDGLNWKRDDDKILLNKSPEIWESDMQCYPCVFSHEKKYYMLYNGNGYGRSGVGLAVLDYDFL